MIFGSYKPEDGVYRRFAWWPKQLRDGRRIWLEHYAYKPVGSADILELPNERVSSWKEHIRSSVERQLRRETEF